MTGVRVREKANGHELVLTAPIVVSDIGPRATNGLLQGHTVTQAQVLKQQATYEMTQTEQGDAFKEMPVGTDVSRPGGGAGQRVGNDSARGIYAPSHPGRDTSVPTKHPFVSFTNHPRGCRTQDTHS